MIRALEKGRQAFASREWRAAFDQLAKADREAALGAADLERLGDAAYLVGKDDESIAAWTRAHNAFVEQDECLRAARLGFWLSLGLMLGGNAAQSGGWLSRTQRLISDKRGECAEHGLMLVISGLFSMFKGDAAKACSQFEQATSLGKRFADPDLLAVSVLSHGQALIQMQRTDEGVALLDEAMIAVTSGQVTPIMAGIIYCAVILTCERVYDLHRAHEWTVALDKWCGAQPELVAFRGQCLVHRSEVLQFKGDWTAALAEAKRACELLSGRSERLAGRAVYQQAELHRLAGYLERAGEAYREAGARGFEPQPGVSLLRLAQGDLKAAAASIRRVASEAGSQQGPGTGVQRIEILGPFVEIMLATDELEPARAAADELARIAAQRKAPFLKATAAQTSGAVLLAGGQPEQALVALREAWTIWQQLAAPFESARARVLIGRACEQLGDGVTAEMHLEAAASIFERLGAAPELARLRVGAVPRGGAAAELSDRERQVLARVASGKTNRQIAADLGISEHTVARHISNIFNKIGVTSRTAASAYAFRNDLV
jgi:DNA-binding CsgD family transcriptional regulator